MAQYQSILARSQSVEMSLSLAATLRPPHKHLSAEYAHYARKTLQETCRRKDTKGTQTTKATKCTPCSIFKGCATEPGISSSQQFLNVPLGAR